MVVSSLQSIQDEFFIDSMECVHQGFEHEMDMSRQHDGSFWQEWKIKFMKLFVEKCTPHGLKSGIIDMMGNVQENFQTNTLLLSKLSCLYVLKYASLQYFYLTLNFHCKMTSKSLINYGSYLILTQVRWCAFCLRHHEDATNAPIFWF